uniref:C2H2-type domain-containing protein n=1 Tax=Rhabditophanes sp. KR3021 TaxID=114890 RepID=A0AC35TN51_9BILA
MRGLILVLFYITIPQVWSACNYVPILQGIAVQQPLGNSNKKVIPGSTDCKSACDTETSFVCTAFLWPGYTGDCYLFDKVDVTKQIFRDNGEYKLYVSVCNNATAPTVGYCEFRINQTNVGYDNVATSLSPALTTQDSCFQFCINQYNGISYNAFIVKPTGLSKCALYPVVPTAQGTGEMNLWTKECRGPPVNCKYSEWSAFGTCSATCGGIRSKTRTILAEASTDGVPCLDSEKTQTEPCGVSCTATGLSTTTVATVSTSLSTSKPTTSGTTISGVTTLASTTSAPTTAVPTTTTLNPNAVETGCKIRNIDANSRPSSKNFRAVGNQPSCMARCKAETNFQCQAFITAGPKTSCLLFGTVDRSVIRSDTTMFTCYTCGETFTDPMLLGVHSSTHPEDLLDRYIQNHESQYICYWCSEDEEEVDLKIEKEIKFAEITLDDVNNNKLNKDPNQMFKCIHCGEMFGSASSRQRHYRLHIGSKSYRCNFCMKTFQRSDALNLHGMKHIKDNKGLECPMPECAFIGNGLKEINDHFNSIHPVSKFTCKCCKKQFTKSENLMLHYYNFHGPLQENRTGYIVS